jgi:hypothetical protein
MVRFVLAKLLGCRTDLFLFQRGMQQMKWVATLLVLCLAVPAQAAIVGVNGGKTNVALESAFLGLVKPGSIEGVEPLPGYPAAFDINSRADAKPTTFTYDSSTFAPFAGEILHTGGLTLDLTSVSGPELTVGDFRIGFDAARANSGRSGFFVQDTLADPTSGLILFDVGEFTVGNPDLVWDAGGFTLNAPLLVSPELGGALDQLTDLADLTGALAGSALVQATAIPEPSSALVMGGLVGVGAIVMGRRRRRRG